MAVDPLQEAVIRVALGLPESGHLALAGGGAMNAHGFVDRPTADIDLFTPVVTELSPIVASLCAALTGRGYAVEISRNEATFARLEAVDPRGARVAVELAVDARMRKPVTLVLGATLDPEELAADKTLALFGRAAARDLVDVDALVSRFGRSRLLELAGEKDPGFENKVFAAALLVASGRPEADFREIDVDAERLARLRSDAQDWSAELRAE